MNVKVHSKQTCQIVMSALLGNLSACSDDPQESTATVRTARAMLINIFFVRVSYNLWISDCRKGSDLGLCSSWHLAYRVVQRSGRIWFQQANCRNSEPIRALHRGIIFARCQELHRRQACSALQIDIWNLYDIRMEKQFSRPQRLLSQYLKVRCADSDRNWNYIWYES